MAQPRKCPDCGGQRFVEDHAQGDIVCAGCGLVVEAHIIDERSEWRTFSDKDGAGQDPNRVGGPTNPLLDGGGLTTVIGKGQGDGSANLNRLHMRSNNPDKGLQTAFRQLEALADRLRLTGPSIKNAACELYKRGVESGKLRGRSTMAICAASMYMACRQNNTPRSFKEITSVMPAEVAKKDISACFKLLANLMKDATKNKDQGLQDQLAPVAQHPASYMKRFCNDLMLSKEMLRALEDMAHAVKPKDESAQSQLHGWDSRSPLSVAAAILYILTMIKDPIPMHQIVAITNVAEATIKVTYKDLYLYLDKLLPPGFNSKEQIAKLPKVDVSKLTKVD